MLQVWRGGWRMWVGMPWREWGKRSILEVLPQLKSLLHALKAGSFFYVIIRRHEQGSRVSLQQRVSNRDGEKLRGKLQQLCPTSLVSHVSLFYSRLHIKPFQPCQACPSTWCMYFNAIIDDLLQFFLRLTFVSHNSSCLIIFIHLFTFQSFLMMQPCVCVCATELSLLLGLCAFLVVMSGGLAPSFSLFRFLNLFSQPG